VHTQTPAPGSLAAPTNCVLAPQSVAHRIDEGLEAPIGPRQVLAEPGQISPEESRPVPHSIRHRSTVPGFWHVPPVVEAAGISAGLLFAGGAVLCLVALGIPTMGLMGAATSLLIAADLTSRGVDLALALVLIAYGAWQVVRRRRKRTTAGASPGTKDDALPTGGRALFAAGLLGMLTNFTSLPLYLSVAQRIGTVAARGGSRSAPASWVEH
jgi:hypothetical protein